MSEESALKKCYEVRASKIHGHGVFAVRDIKNGEKILDYLGEIVGKDEADKRGLAYEENAKKCGGGSVWIFELNDTRFIDGNFEYNDARFINHACRTNCEAVCSADTISFYATRDIRAGEEILYNYGYALEHFFENPCRCGFPECVGYIVAVEDRPRLRKLLHGRKNKAARGKK